MTNSAGPMHNTSAQEEPMKDLDDLSQNIVRFLEACVTEKPAEAYVILNEQKRKWKILGQHIIGWETL